MQFLADMFTAKIAPPPGVKGTAGESGFLAGTAAMIPNGRWFTPSVRANAKFNWGVVEMPEGPGGKKTWLFWGPYLINAKTKNPDKAWTVLKALTSPEVEGKVAAMGSNIPSNKGQAGVDMFLNSKPPEDNTPFIKGADYAMAEIPLFTANWGDVVDAIYQPAVDKIIAGEASVADATAGIAAVPGSDMPSASARQAMVLAVPMTAQVPAVVASLLSTSVISAALTVFAR